MSSTERKRIRDRRAQQKHRQRKDLYTKQLEDQVAFCQRNHEPANIQSLMEKVEQLEAVNETLLRERDRLLNLANHFQEYLTTFFSTDQHHSHVNVRADFSKSSSSSTARPMSVACQSGINAPPVCDSTSTSRETDATATRRHIPIPPEQLTPTWSNDGAVRAVDSGDKANTTIFSCVGTEALVTNGRQPLSTYSSICPSSTPAIRDYRVLRTPSREHEQIQTVDEDFSPTSIDGLSQTALSDGSTTTTTIPIEQAGTEHTALSTSAASPEIRLSPSGASNETHAFQLLWQISAGSHCQQTQLPTSRASSTVMTRRTCRNLKTSCSDLARTCWRTGSTKLYG